MFIRFRVLVSQARWSIALVIGCKSTLLTIFLLTLICHFLTLIYHLQFFAGKMKVLWQNDLYPESLSYPIWLPGSC